MYLIVPTPERILTQRQTIANTIHVQPLDLKSSLRISLKKASTYSILKAYVQGVCLAAGVACTAPSVQQVWCGWRRAHQSILRLPGPLVVNPWIRFQVNMKPPQPWMVYTHDCAKKYQAQQHDSACDIHQICNLLRVRINAQVECVSSKPTSREFSKGKQTLVTKQIRYEPKKLVHRCYLRIIYSEGNSYFFRQGTHSR
jgi:hypothetical protein